MSRDGSKDAVVRDRIRRMEWWKASRFGMFIHWGLYSQIGRHEWVMNRERIPIGEYERYADTWRPKPRPMRDWARLAKAAGMKYMVMTTKHHEGFCLWDTQQTEYNSVKRGPGRDLVREYVEACREFGLRIGFYYSLMDWHHPDGARCAYDGKARRRFCDFTQGCVRELLTNYGKIDILWHDVSWPLKSPELWESRKMNAMARRLQPHILINNRSQLPEDFGTPEGHAKPEPEKDGRGWEACMTYNSSWGYMPCDKDWRSNREVIGLIERCTAFNGNLLLNVGPKPDGSLPPEAAVRLHAIGKWLKTHAEAIYGKMDRIDEPGVKTEWMPLGGWTVKGKRKYFWCRYWPDGKISIGGLKNKVKGIINLTTRKKVRFTQTGNRLVMHGLPVKCPDRIAGITLFRLEFGGKLKQQLGLGCVILPPNVTSSF